MSSTHLIIVCCHAIWLSPQPQTQDSTPLSTSDLEAEHNWLIAPFQTGETSTFIRHAKEALKLLYNDADALLLFSGGPTRHETRTSEARSYYNLALAAGFWDIFTQSRDRDRDQNESRDSTVRIGVEENALDSYQNVLFSILNFWRVTGNWPRKITIVSHAFKRARFIDLHLTAMKWLGDVRYLGIDPEYMSGEEDGDGERAAEVREGERVRGYDVWAEDMYGVGEVLVGKQRARNPWGIKQDVWEEGMGEEVRDLLRWNGEFQFEAPLPWNVL